MNLTQKTQGPTTYSNENGMIVRSLVLSLGYMQAKHGVWSVRPRAQDGDGGKSVNMTIQRTSSLELQQAGFNLFDRGLNIDSV